MKKYIKSKLDHSVFTTPAAHDAAPDPPPPPNIEKIQPIKKEARTLPPQNVGRNKPQSKITRIKKEPVSRNKERNKTNSKVDKFKPEPKGGKTQPPIVIGALHLPPNIGRIPKVKSGIKPPLPLNPPPLPLDPPPIPSDQPPRPLDQPIRSLNQLPQPFDQLPQPLDQPPRHVDRPPRPVNQRSQPLDQSPRHSDQPCRRTDQSFVDILMNIDLDMKKESHDSDDGYQIPTPPEFREFLSKLTSNKPDTNTNTNTDNQIKIEHLENSVENSTPQIKVKDLGELIQNKPQIRIKNLRNLLETRSPTPEVQVSVNQLGNRPPVDVGQSSHDTKDNQDNKGKPQKIMCRDFAGGTCEKNENCKFSHEQIEPELLGQAAGQDVGQSSNNTENSQDNGEQSQKIMCRDFMRGTCERNEKCKFSHEGGITELRGLYTFCHKYQNSVCTYTNCKYVHASVFEEQNFYRTGILPPHALAHQTRNPPIPSTPPPQSQEELSEPQLPIDISHINFNSPPPPLPLNLNTIKRIPPPPLPPARQPPLSCHPLPLRQPPPSCQPPPPPQSLPPRQFLPPRQPLPPRQSLPTCQSLNPRQSLPSCQSLLQRPCLPPCQSQRPRQGLHPCQSLVSRTPVPQPANSQPFNQFAVPRVQPLNRNWNTVNNFQVASSPQAHNHATKKCKECDITEFRLQSHKNMLENMLRRKRDLDHKMAILDAKTNQINSQIIGFLQTTSQPRPPYTFQAEPESESESEAESSSS